MNRETLMMEGIDMILEACSVEKWYLRGKGDSNRFFAVKSTDLKMESGKVTVLTGRSGSGKTTLMKEWERKNDIDEYDGGTSHAGWGKDPA